MDITQISETLDTNEDPPVKRVIIRLFPEVAPKHISQIKTLSNEGFYNEVIFHRVIEGFMAQTGDPTGTGMGGSDLTDIRAE
ncbi:MAG: peptidylprolyl isomerase, partial [Pseudomonadota bacterium]|nr:peptidylprolyl isomerase [Pseudomonadota bacterium]